VQYIYIYICVFVCVCVCVCVLFYIVGGKANDLILANIPLI